MKAVQALLARSPTSLLLALASLGALGAQALLGLALVRFFSPEAAGRFAVVAQIAFFWITLALAQAPLQFLADAQRPATAALRAVLRPSLARWLALAPLVSVGVWWAAPPDALQALAWAALLALLQMLWYLAQPWALRTAPAWSAALVRAAPPLLAVVLAASLGSLWPGAGAHALLLAAGCGYALGALWLLRPAPPPLPLQPPPSASQPVPASTDHTAQADGRSTRLRLAHAVVDALTGVALLLVWQRLHGLAQASYLAVLLRLLGFMPAIVQAAWTQVLLAQARIARGHSLLVGLGAAATTGLIGLCTAVLLQATELAPSWRGLLPAIAPLVLWQASACLFAALGHRPFQSGRESHYSYATIAYQLLQWLVLALPLLAPSLVTGGWTPTLHLWLLAGTSSLGLLGLAAWMAWLAPRHKTPGIAPRN